MKKIFITISGISDLINEDDNADLLNAIRVPKPKPSDLHAAIKSNEETLMRIAASSKYIDDKDLQTAITCVLPRVRAAAASNEKCSVNMLKKAAYDKNPKVRYEVAKNKNTDKETATLLADDPINYVAATAIRSKKVLATKIIKLRETATDELILDALKSLNKIVHKAEKVNGSEYADRD